MNQMLIDRVLAEYRQWPGLRLTLPQATRLWAAAPDECRSALDGLVANGELYRDERGQYARRARTVHHRLTEPHWRRRALRLATRQTAAS
jgi:hypothetical protein